MSWLFNVDRSRVPLDEAFLSHGVDTFNVGDIVSLMAYQVHVFLEVVFYVLINLAGVLWNS